MGDFNLPLLFLIFLFFNIPNPAADRSLATPETPRQSWRFGVMPISIIVSFSPAISAYGWPTFTLSSSLMIPS